MLTFLVAHLNVSTVMKVALTHDHMIQNGGAERVLEVLQDMWPSAPTYTLLYDKKKMDSTFGHRDIRTSFLQSIPFSLKKYRWLLPFMPTATEQYNLSEFEVIVSSSSALSKGIIPPEFGLHICYCHTPPRYLWTDTYDYIQSMRAPRLAKLALPLLMNYLRMWDRASADRVDFFIANSETVRHRIKRFYGRDSVVIHPPVSIEKFKISKEPKRYFLIGGRLVPYKRYDIVIEAFNKLGRPLKIFGDGPQMKELQKLAKPNIEFLGRVSDEKRSELFENAIGFIHPQEEDFGITPVESMAAGTPVIAYAKGGATETVIDGKTGILFDKQCWEEIADTVFHFDAHAFDPVEIRKHAEQFSVQNFRKKILDFTKDKWRHHRRNVLNRI